MIKIALCDDNPIFLKEIQKLIENYLIHYCMEAKISMYSSGQSFLNQFKEDHSLCDILFLDINMPAIDGIEIAEQVRNLNHHLILIFITSIEDRVYETFQFNTFRFIRKSCIMNELEECLVKAIKLIKNERFSCSFKTKEGVVHLFAKEILYFIYINRHVEVKTLDGYYILTITRFQDIISQFMANDFVLIHRGCLVNVKYIRVIHKLYIILDNHEKLSISRYKFNDVFRAFTNYAR